MRRKDREMDEAFAWNIADKCEYAVLSVTLADNTPYCVPISIVCFENSVYFHCANSGKKTEALRQNPRVCIACVGNPHRMKHLFTTEYESAILFGRAEEIMDDYQKIQALRLLCQRHAPKNMDGFDEAIQRSLGRTAVWRVNIEQSTGKRKKYDQHGKEMKYGRME